MTQDISDLVRRLRQRSFVRQNKDGTAVGFTVEDEDLEMLAPAADALERLQRELDQINRLVVAQNQIVRDVWNVLGGEDQSRPGGANLVNRVREIVVGSERLQRELETAKDHAFKAALAAADERTRATTAERALATARAEAFREAMRVVEQWLQQMADMGAPILNADLPRAIRARAEESKPHE